MHFRKTISYPRPDSSLVRKGTIARKNRVVVLNGVKRRCQTILNAFGRVKNKPRSCVQVHRLVSKRYRVEDIAYAFRKLESANLLERVSCRGDKHMLMRRTRGWKGLWKQTK
jgi:hypothetical protein